MYLLPCKYEYKQCLILGTPAPALSWAHGTRGLGQLVTRTNGEGGEGEVASLLLDTVSRHQAGVYTCTGDTGHQAVTKQVTISSLSLIPNL